MGMDILLFSIRSRCELAGFARPSLDNLRPILENYRKRPALDNNATDQPPASGARCYVSPPTRRGKMWHLFPADPIVPRGPWEASHLLPL